MASPTSRWCGAARRPGAEERCDTVIGFGGGAALDAAKAIAILMTNPGDVTDYLEIIGRGKTLTEPPVPCIAIPTTAGTGSEVTRNSVIASREERVKVSLRSPLMLPKVVVVDPELTYDLPPAITASTGVDALTQLIEPFVCSRANPLTDGLCQEGIERVARSLRRAFESAGRGEAPADAAAREDMAVASLFGGLALANAGLGAVHGLAAPLGGMIGAPHGAVCAALLPSGGRGEPARVAGTGAGKSGAAALREGRGAAHRRSGRHAGRRGRVAAPPGRRSGHPWARRLWCRARARSPSWSRRPPGPAA